MYMLTGTFPFLRSLTDSRLTHFWKIRFLNGTRICVCWGFLALAPASCGTAHGWLRRQGLQRLMMDSKTRWQLWNNDPGRDRGNCGPGEIQNSIVWFPIFDGDTVEHKCSWISPVTEQWHEALWYSDITKPAAKWSAEQCGAAAPTACQNHMASD